MKRWVVSLVQVWLAACVLWMGLQGSVGAPVCKQNSGCSCNITDICTVCPRGLVPAGDSFLGPRHFSPDAECLKISKGSSEELFLLRHFSRLMHLEIHRYFIPTASRETLPFYRSINLRHLSLSNNGIQTITDDLFAGLSFLTVLDLSRNQLHTIPPLSFIHLHSLESLRLQQNLLDNLPLELLTSQQNLKVLNLGDNKLSFLHHEQFNNVTVLENLDISKNNFKAVPKEVVEDFSRLKDLHLHSNPWDCSCSVGPLAMMLQRFPNLSSKIPPLCKIPLKYKSKALTELTIDEVNCSVPLIVSVSESQNAIYNSKFTLTCRAEGEPAPTILWRTPMGDYFGHPSGYHLLNQSDLVRVRADNMYVFGDHLQKTYVTSEIEGQITVDGMRGSLRGNFTCTAVNPAGIDSANILITVHTGLPVAYTSSLLFSAEVTGAFIVVGFFIGIISFIVNRCCSRTKKIVEETPEKEEEVLDVSDTKSESTMPDLDYNLDSDDDSPAPGASPLLSGDGSPGRCRTPTGEEYDKFAAEFPENIKETLDDVRWRLRHGVERKIERVRTHVLTIKSSGSQYIDTLRSSSSQAANRVRAGVVMGMEQVKYGVQSIREFCGTGDMGAQTISTISVSTDVDTQESTETIKTSTIV